MSPEPAELQILRQILGHDLGSLVFALNTLAGSCAQMGQQIAEQAQKIEQLGAPSQAPAMPSPAASENPWTGPEPPKEATT